MRKHIFILLMATLVAACTSSPALPPEEPIDPPAPDSLTWDGEAYTDGLLRFALLDSTTVEVITPDTAHLTLPAELSIPPSVRIGSRDYTVVQIGHACFQNCDDIQRVHLPSTIRRIRGGGFWSCHSLTDINLPDGITYISDEAFAFCEALTTLHLPAGLTELSREVVSNCSSLREIEIPPSVTAIGVGAFSGCYALTHISIPPKVTSLEYSTFAGCRSLQSVTFQGTTQLSYKVFTVCQALREIHCLSATPSTYIADTAFDPAAYDAITVFVPKEAVEAYKASPCWGKFKITPEP